MKSMEWLLGFLLAGSLGVSVWSQPANPPPTYRYFSQVAVGHAGNLRFDTDFLFINGGAETDFALDFFDSTGEPLAVMQFREGANPEVSATLRKRMRRGETLNLSTRLPGGARIGYARVMTSGEVSGVVAYSRTDVDASRVQYQNAAPFSLLLQDFTIAVKFVPGVGDMAFAIVNPPSESVNPGEEETARIVFRLYDEAFQPHGTAETVLPRGGHMARFIGQLFPELVELAHGVGFNGSMTVESSRPLAVMSVLHTEVPTLITVAVNPGRADVARPAEP